ncbi:MAG: hypothetical protein J5756_07230 [Clostridia bacterium]|nr:hypothetical protein [Clostridia bacterium]
MPKNETVKKEAPEAEVSVNERRFVPIFIPAESDEDELHNKYFSVNGKTYGVPVGIEVSVPEEVAAAYEESKAGKKNARQAILNAQENLRARDKAFMG